MTVSLSPLTPAEVIKATRAAQEMSLREFGSKLGVSQTMIANYESGKSAPSEEQVSTWMRNPIKWISDMAVEIHVVNFRSILKASVAVTAPAEAV